MRSLYGATKLGGVIVTNEELREQIAKEIEDAPHHHNMLGPCDGCKDKEFYLQVIRKELPCDTR